MNAIQLIRQEFSTAHEILEMTMADVTPDIANFNKTGKALPAGAAYAHAVMGEDIVLSTMIAMKPAVFKDAASIGVSAPMPDMTHWADHEKWYQTVTVDLPKFREYAKEVYKATDDYLTTLKEEDLDREMDMGEMGKKNLAWLLSAYLLLHVANLTGEISSAKGIQGLKGYPF